jgi:hypothetical protein
VTVDGAGISLAIPPGWTRTAAGDVSNEVVTVGDAARPGPGAPTSCVTATSTTAGTWVSLYEYPPGTTDVVDPAGLVAGRESINGPVPPRPADFSAPSSWQKGTCGVSSGTVGPGPTALTSRVPVQVPANEYDRMVFEDAGRIFLVRIVTVRSADVEAAIALARQVLNTLHVDPLTASATTTTAGSSEPLASTTVPGVPPGVVPTEVGSNGGGFFNPTSADQQQIELAFLGWLRGKTLDEAALHIEDFASIRDAEAQGIAQHTPQDLAGFDGRVESVVITDPTHADVVYTVLHDGQPLYPNRPGKAVKVGGKWMVTRDTACALLSMGGITCPSRTTPTP